MKFSFWYYICKIGGILFPLCFLAFLGENYPILEIIGKCFIVIFVILGLVGAVMGIFMTMGKLKMRCPFCKGSGIVDGNKQNGLYMECENCGLIHGVGFLKIKLIQEKINTERN